jgi:type IV pilus assembly protein PilV
MKLEQRSRGFALMEVMIALFVLAIGILGAGAMQAVAMQATFGNYNRTQAMVLASDIVDRIRANRAQMVSYNGTDTNEPPSPNESCLSSVSGCSAEQIVDMDKKQWALAFNNLRIPNGRGKVDRTGATDNFVITITWDESEWNDGEKTRSVQPQTYRLAVTI